MINLEKQIPAKPTYTCAKYKYTADRTTNTKVTVERKETVHFTQCAFFVLRAAPTSVLHALSWLHLVVFKLYTGLVNWFSVIQSQLQDWMDLELLISEDARH